MIRSPGLKKAICLALKMKINIQHLKNKYTLEVESLDTTVCDLKKMLEDAMNESVRIPASEQTLIFEREKLEDDKKLSEYIKNDAEDVKMFVIRQQKTTNPISKPASFEANTQQQNAPRPMGNPYANFAHPSPNPYAFGSPYGGGYGSPQGMYGQMPPQYPGYGSPQGMFGQMPPPQYPGYGSPQGQFGQGDGQNEAFSNMMMQQMEHLINDPAMLDQVLGMHAPNMVPEQREAQKKMLKDALSMMKSNPALFQQAFTPERMNWAFNNMGGGNMNMPPPYAAMQNTQHGDLRNGPCSHGFYPPVYNNGKPEPRSYEEVFSKQLVQLRDMGFTDDDASIEALKKAGGDINQALDFLYGGKK